MRRMYRHFGKHAIEFIGELKKILEGFRITKVRKKRMEKRKRIFLN